MLDLSFIEIAVIALVALIVVGPTRLPAVARTIGILLGRIRGYAIDVKREVNKELYLDEIKQAENNFKADITNAAQNIKTELDQIKSSVEEVAPNKKITKNRTSSQENRDQSS